MTDVAYSSMQGMKIDAAGRITYDFDGHVHAKGLDLDTSNGDLPQRDQALNILAEDGLIAGHVAGFGAAGSDEGLLWLRAFSRSGQDPAHSVTPLDASAFAELRLGAQNLAGQNKTSIYATAGADAVGSPEQRLIIDENGASDFLQLAAGSFREVGFDLGSYTITWPGGGAVSNAQSQPHQLGRTPGVLFAIANTDALLPSWVSKDNNQVTFKWRDVTGGVHGTGSFGFALWGVFG